MNSYLEKKIDTVDIPTAGNEYEYDIPHKTEAFHISARDMGNIKVAFKSGEIGSDGDFKTIPAGQGFKDDKGWMSPQAEADTLYLTSDVDGDTIELYVIKQK